MTIGIAGSTGFIGSYLLNYFLRQGRCAIRTMVRSSTAVSNQGATEILQGDLLSPSDCERFVTGLETIYYLAHVNSPVNSDVDPAHDTALNLVPLLNLLQAVERIKSRPHIVYFSSGGAIYESNPSIAAYCETDPCSPRSSYGIQKLAAEHYLRLAAERERLTATVMRVGNAYGVPLPHYRLQGLIGVAVNSVLQGKPVRVFGDPRNVRDYVHLEDISAFAAWAARPERQFDIFNVGSGVGHSVSEVLRLIEASYGQSIRILSDDAIGAGLVDRVVLDVRKALRVAGWKPVIDLRRGIDSMLAECGRDVMFRVERA